MPYPDGIRVVDEALRRLARGEALQPLRSVMAVPGRAGLLGSMPAYLAVPETLGTKVLTVFPANRERGSPSHQGVVALFDPAHGEPLALVDAGAITEIRTACASAVATRALAREGAEELVILGCGAQAESHALAIPHVRPIRRIELWDRRPERARALADRLATIQRVPTEVRPDAEPAVRRADIVCTTTASPTPVLLGDWLAAGTHVNAVGAVGPGLRELDTEAVRRSRVFVDRRESVLTESEDVRVPLAEGAIAPAHLRGELGEVLLGTTAGRLSNEDITLFKSVGLAVEDLAAARYAYDRALALGVGSRVDFSTAGSAPKWAHTL
ncbi:MAG: ornithine cyclodeaminase family protein [Thermoplasmata archaeon]